MCGLAGFLVASGTSEAARLRAVVTRMADTLRHRGPDDGDTWVDPDAGVALGFRRLSIIDLSPDGRQPMRSACGRYVIAFNGEIYNHRDLRHDLEASATPGTLPLRGHSDTEVMLEVISRFGLEPALERFNGMFAFALWDRLERQLHLVRDRLGEKPLYYGRAGRTLLFGSELAALRAHPDFAATVDRDALALYLRYDHVPAPYSIYTGIRKLPAGTRLTLPASDGGPLPEPVAYWALRDVAERGLAKPFHEPAPEVTDRLDALLRDATRMRMEADVPLGAFLSGGVDSSTVVALMQAESDRPVKTFTIGFREREYNEAEHARAVARHLGTDHTELYVTPEETMAVIPRLPSLYSEPFSDSSQIPTFLVSRLARESVTVSLSGDGGDELFGGYTRYRIAERLWRAMRWTPGGVRAAAAHALAALPPTAWDALFRRLGPVLPRPARQRHPGDKLHRLSELMQIHQADDVYLWLVSHWKDPASLVLGATELSTTHTDHGGWPGLADFWHRMLFVDAATYLPDDILVKVDRASMGVSLEARVPLLDHRVVEFAWRVPRSMMTRDHRTKWILRQVLERYVPRALVERPKMGFGVPIGAWLRGPLRDWAEALLDEGRLRREGFLDPRPVRERWKEHLAGRRNWHIQLWDVLMFEAWLDEQARPSAAARLGGT